MDVYARLDGVRSARRGRVAAKVVSLRGGTSTNAGFEGKQLMLDGMRIFLASQVGYPRLFLARRNGGFALFLQVSHGPRVWLIAERSRRVRIFKRFETAETVCRQFDTDRVVVLLDEGAPVESGLQTGAGN
jgi:hypothetical protein